MLIKNNVCQKKIREPKKKSEPKKKKVKLEKNILRRKKITAPQKNRCPFIIGTAPELDTCILSSINV